ncbi:MAG: tRNA 2-thiouridine(34) synthase MnmA [Porticoccus sp.]|jgi:tRNA-specific 2-thiouridylase|uniref:tRNA 2-thiouridine(34) synthase MnmA n=1 Tax=Porticoccus sp. Uisw_050_02 TaxID=3230978 RepID=UPI0030B12780|tara:strand:- start:292 stop:1422 length:1131 start_codon:yes stop_codon:yes gene_type:complete
MPTFKKKTTLSTQAAKTKVIVGMSGGVDSSVTALLLKQQGYVVEGLFMKNWDEDDGTEYCTAQQDMSDAQSVADMLKIPLHSVNFASEYWDDVFQIFLQEYKSGRTPNPDILCNKEIKFKVFLDYAELLGGDYIATGHYARTSTKNGRTYLLKGIDDSKDQSYFLHAVNEAAFSRTLFPIGEMKKTEVRKIAEEYGLITAKKKDSTGICFIGERRFKDFLEQYLPGQPGNIESSDGDIIGQHSGLMYYTLGQRQGLGVGGLKTSDDNPWYVSGKDLSRNTLIAVQGGSHPLLFSDSLKVSELHWINGLPEEIIKNENTDFSCQAKTRYRQDDQQCQVIKTEGGYLMKFNTPQRSLTPGQSVVLYRDSICLGGGVIK